MILISRCFQEIYTQSIKTTLSYSASGSLRLWKRRNKGEGTQLISPCHGDREAPKVKQIFEQAYVHHGHACRRVGEGSILMNEEAEGGGWIAGAHAMNPA